MNSENRGVRPSIIILVVMAIALIVGLEFRTRITTPATVLHSSNKNLTAEEINNLRNDLLINYDYKSDELVMYDYYKSEEYSTRGVYELYKNGEITNERIAFEINEGTKKYKTTPVVVGVSILVIVVVGMVIYKKRLHGGMASVKDRIETDIDVISKDRLTIGLDQVKGHNEILEDIQAVIDFIKNPCRYTMMGARLPKGILLFGPPGTGKTMLAKAVAKESDVTFIQSTGSDFVEKYVGVGAKRVRELFKEARKKAPCIIFIDEIDAIGRARGGEDNNSERDNTLNALLTEMDGFNNSEQIFVMASTNRLDILDPALIRAGRFDKHIAVNLPDVQGRKEILQIYSKNKKLATDVNLDYISKMTAKFSGADLENLMNEATILAVRKSHKEITNEDIDTAMYSIQVKGRQKDKYVRSFEETELTAFHEAGHTLASIMLAEDEVTKVTIIPSTSGAGGITFTNPKDVTLMSKTDLENKIRMLYAGRAAEYVLTKNEDLVTTGAYNDIERATELMLRMVSEYGMFKEFGLINMNKMTGNIQVEAKVKELSIKYYNESIEFLERNYDRLSYLAKQLMKYETLYSEQIIEILAIE